MLLVVGVALVMIRDLFAVAMLTGIYSLLSACFFMLQDAVDVAFTEAAVGAGITTVLFLATMSQVGRSERKPTRKPWAAIAVCSVVAALLIYASFDMPKYGDPQAPVHQHVAPRYIEDSPDEVGPPNMVTSVLASYRGYDTLGETGVVFTAGVGVLLLLGPGFRRRYRKDIAAADKGSQNAE